MSQAGMLLDGKYELVSLAGEGGMATVWRAIVRGAAGFTRPVAIKKMREEFRAMKNYIAMFVEEARVGAEMAHPNIVQVYDFCIDDNGSYYLVLEWVDGVDFGTIVQQAAARGTPLEWQVLALVAIGTLRGLGAAHERIGADGQPSPVIHRDVSPHNILVSRHGVAKLGDFGLARARDRVMSLTAPGTVKGKLHYLSPEVTMGKPVSPQSDVFAMGVLMWETLAGKKLFTGRADIDVFKAIRKCEIPDLAAIRPDVPAALCQIVHKALERELELRYASARAMESALADVLRRNLPGDVQAQLASLVLQAMGVNAPGGAGAVDDADTQSWTFNLDA
ncbi:MAG: serine/threonine protein kinase [Myxococcales bacterium]|nr:serine/threonine protein kinase [Myxococcales bacterium]